MTERKIKLHFIHFHMSVSVFKSQISSLQDSTTTDLITESNISETGFQHLEIQVISVHAFENKICTLMYSSFAFC